MINRKSLVIKNLIKNSAKNLLIIFFTLTVFFSCVDIEQLTNSSETSTLEPTPLVYAEANQVQFNQQFTAKPEVASGYSLTNYQLSYEVSDLPADGVASIYSQGVQEQLTINPATGAIVFPSGFRVGYALRVTVIAEVGRVDISKFNQSGESTRASSARASTTTSTIRGHVKPGDKVIAKFVYRVNDNKVDTDNDGVMDGIDPDIDGDSLANLDDVEVFSRTIKTDPKTELTVEPDFKPTVKPRWVRPKHKYNKFSINPGIRSIRPSFLTPTLPPFSNSTLPPASTSNLTNVTPAATIPAIPVVAPGELDIAFVMDGSSSIGDGNFSLIREWVKEIMASLKQIDEARLPANAESGLDIRYHAVSFFHRGRVEFVDGKIVVTDDFRYNWLFNFQEGLALSKYVDSIGQFIKYDSSPDSFTATAMRAVADVGFLNNSIYQDGAGTVLKENDYYSGTRSDSTKVMIVITDGGVSSGDYFNIATAHKYVTDNGISIITTGVPDVSSPGHGSNGLRYLATGNISQDQVNGIQVVFPVEGFSSMSSINDDLIDSVMSIYQANSN